jgi:hypothetical protein
MPQLPDDFADLLIELVEAGARFLLVGGYAVAHHGYPRATKDIDIWIEPTQANAPQVLVALSRFGAPIAALGLSVADFASPGQVVQLGVPPLRIDILTTIDGVSFESAWSTRDHFQLGDYEIPIIDRAHLLANKRSCGRPQDLVDADALESLD